MTNALKTNYRMRKGLIFSFLLILFNLSATAQYGYYYEHGRSATDTHMSNQRGSRYVTQFTHFNLDYVSARVHAFMVYSINKVPMEEMQQKKSGKYTIFSRRYKSEFSDEINTEFNITTEYKTELVAGEYVIVSTKIFGYESYVGKFLEDFWDPAMNASDKKSGEVMKFNFLDDHISVNLWTDKKTYLDKASLVITNTSTANFSTYKSKLETYLSDFKQKREEKTYQLETESAELYAKNKEIILEVVKKELLNIGEDHNYSGNLTIHVDTDTTGNHIVNVPNDFPGSIRINEILSKRYLNSLVIRDYQMRTSDKYSFNIDFYSEVGEFFSKKELNFSKGSERYKKKVEEEFSTVYQGRGIYTVQAKELKIDNTDIETPLNATSFDKKMGPLGYAAIAGAATIGILYYFVF